MINYRLASAINPPASPSTSLRFHRSSDLRSRFESVSDLRRRPTLWRRQQSTSDFPKTASFGLSFSSASDLRRLLRLWVFLRTNFRSFVGPLIFQLTFQPTSNLRWILHRPVLPSNPTPDLRQVSRLPAFLLDRPPTCVRYRILQFCLPINFRLIIGYRVSDFAFRPASDLRRCFVIQLCLPTNLPDFHRAFCPRAFPSNQASDSRRLLLSPVLSAINPRLPSEFESSSGAVDQLPTLVDY